ncbi:MAG: LpxL/LpxP family Kdo(2)-lipid IV(A) lauroyl/palmitoleoyl acyltransferase [Pseudomonadota bacterium]
MTRPPKPPLAPRHWPTWLGVGILWLLSHLPYRILMNLGRALGSAVFPFAKRRRRIADTNLHLCFPQWSETQRRQVLKAHFQALGMMLFEAALSWWGSERTMRALSTITGLEHLRTALDRGKGVLLLGAHFTTIEITGNLFYRHARHPVSGLYRQHENPVLDYLFQRGRHQFFEQLIARDDIRSVLRGLKQNQIMWYAPDQAYRGRQSIEAPFFGHPAQSTNATMRIAKISGAAVTPFYCERLPAGRGYQLHVLPALKDFPSGDDIADQTQINQIFERIIARIPEQYFWVHRRFKPARGQADPYRPA